MPKSPGGEGEPTGESGMTVRELTRYAGEVEKIVGQLMGVLGEMPGVADGYIEEGVKGTLVNAIDQKDPKAILAMAQVVAQNVAGDEDWDRFRQGHPDYARVEVGGLLPEDFPGELEVKERVMVWLAELLEAGGVVEPDLAQGIIELVVKGTEEEADEVQERPGEAVRKYKRGEYDEERRQRLASFHCRYVSFDIRGRMEEIPGHGTMVPRKAIEALVSGKTPKAVGVKVSQLAREWEKAQQEKDPNFTTVKVGNSFYLTYEQMMDLARFISEKRPLLLPLSPETGVVDAG